MVMKRPNKLFLFSNCEKFADKVSRWAINASLQSPPHVQSLNLVIFWKNFDIFDRRLRGDHFFLAIYDSGYGLVHLYGNEYITPLNLMLRYC